MYISEQVTHNHAMLHMHPTYYEQICPVESLSKWQR